MHSNNFYIKGFSFLKQQVVFLVTLVISFPLIFKNAIVYDFPMGYAGLFTQMAQQIVDSNFLLPDASPYYGPGGIPFAYPPLGLYLLAILIKITGKYYFFLRWLPPIFSLISIGLTFILCKKYFKSPLISAYTAIIASTSLDLYIAHTWSSGIVRAPAFIFTILVMYFYAWNTDQRSIRDTILAGLFFGFAILSHLAYALFCFFWMIFFLPSVRNWQKSLRDLSLSTFIGLFISLIWIIPVVSRHGWDVFLRAFNSHGGERLSFFSIDAYSILYSFQLNLMPITSNPLLMVLCLIGLYYIFQQKHGGFILFSLLIIVLFPENARFVFWLGCFLAGCGLYILSDWISKLFQKWKNISHITRQLIASIPLLTILWWNGFNLISRTSPFLNRFALDLAENAPIVFNTEGKYLALLLQDEAEWMPFLLKQEPLVSQWGSEWLGTYNQQTFLMLLFQDCRREKDWLCVQNVLLEMKENPQFIITYRIDRKLNEQIQSDGKWIEIFVNNRYIVWEALK